MVFGSDNALIFFPLNDLIENSCVSSSNFSFLFWFPNASIKRLSHFLVKLIEKEEKVFSIFKEHKCQSNQGSMDFWLRAVYSLDQCFLTFFNSRNLIIWRNLSAQNITVYSKVKIGGTQVKNHCTRQKANHFYQTCFCFLTATKARLTDQAKYVGPTRFKVSYEDQKWRKDIIWKTKKHFAPQI